MVGQEQAHALGGLLKDKPDTQRDDEERMMRRTSNFPPANNYNPEFRTTVNKGPVWGFGTAKRGGLTVGKSVAPSM